jgi:hypothetical protein
MAAVSALFELALMPLVPTQAAVFETALLLLLDLRSRALLPASAELLPALLAAGEPMVAAAPELTRVVAQVRTEFAPELAAAASATGPTNAAPSDVEMVDAAALPADGEYSQMDDAAGSGGDFDDDYGGASRAEEGYNMAVDDGCNRPASPGLDMAPPDQDFDDEFF